MWVNLDTWYTLYEPWLSSVYYTYIHTLSYQKFTVDKCNTPCNHGLYITWKILRNISFGI